MAIISRQIPVARVDQIEDDGIGADQLRPKTLNVFQEVFWVALIPTWPAHLTLLGL